MAPADMDAASDPFAKQDPWGGFVPTLHKLPTPARQQNGPPPGSGEAFGAMFDAFKSAAKGQDQPPQKNVPMAKALAADPVITKIATDLAALTALVKQQATLLHVQGSAIQGVKQQQTSDIQECRNMFASIMGMAATTSSGSAN